MTSRIVEIAAVLIAMAVLAVPLAAQERKAPVDVSGKWTMKLKSHQGELTLALTLKQADEKLTGTWSTPHGSDVPLTGSIKDTQVSLASAEGQELQVTLIASLKPDGTLTGTLSSAMGDSPWTAVRAK